MDTRNISILLTSLGVSSHRKGYHFLLHLVGLATTYKDQPFPRIKDLYQQTAEHFDVTASAVEHNIRTVVRLYWEQKDSAKNFSAVIHYPVSDHLSVKEFVSVIAEYVLNYLS